MAVDNEPCERTSTVPRSRRRNKDDYSPQGQEKRTPGVSGRWVAPTMVVLLVVGLVWIVVYYVAGSDIPLMREIGGWNLVIGMGLITAGFITATQWK
jgi:Cell division protein CrgA